MIVARIAIALLLLQFIAALAIPTSIISTFALMYAMGYTLNSITMKLRTFCLLAA